MKTTLLRQKADYLGISGSLLCMLHCLVTPMLVMTSTLLNHDTIRIGFLNLDYLFIGINVVAVWSASRHTSTRIKTALWTCLAVFATGLLLEDLYDSLDYVAYTASLGLVITHVINIRHCRNQLAH